MQNDRIYAVRNTETGKLVSNLSNHHKKYWDRKADLQAAIKNSFRYRDTSPGTLKIVEFMLVEVEK